MDWAAFSIGVIGGGTLIGLLMRRYPTAPVQTTPEPVRETHSQVAPVSTLKETPDAAELESVVRSAMERLTGQWLESATTTAVPIPGEEMKARLIGREGRNIKAFEQSTGVELLIDESSDRVVLAGFDPERREIARLALNNLMIDGRIHPGRIQEAAEAAASDLAIVRREAVDQVLVELNLVPLPSALTDHLEALRFRTSYGQNLLAHSREVAEIAALIAAELGLDVKAARVAGLLHDVGKAAHSDDARPHAVVGAEWARQAGLGEDVAHAIEAHHHDVPPATALAHLIILADRISAARPAARRESLERLVQRIKELEELARSEPGVQDAFAVRAGRELRVLVRSQERDDAACQALAEKLALRISEQGLSPFPVKVTVLRESQFRAESQ